MLTLFILKAISPGNTLPTSPSHEKVSFGSSKIGIELTGNVKTNESQVTVIEDAGNECYVRRCRQGSQTSASACENWSERIRVSVGRCET